MSEIDPVPVSPVVPPPVPIPAQPLVYSAHDAERRRPALITATGVLAIIIACMSGLMSGLICLYSILFFAMSKFTPTVSATSVSATSSFSTTPGAAKLSIADGGVAVNTLRSTLQLDGARTRELDKIMRAHGRQILGGEPDDAVTDAGLRESLKESAPASNPSSPAHFVTEEGRVEIYTDHVVFTSADGTRTLESSAIKNSESESFSATSVAYPGASTIAPTTQPQDSSLTPAQVRLAISAIKKHAPSPLNVAQLTTLEAQLSAPNQQLLTPGNPAPVNNVMPQGPNVMVQFDSAMVTLGPKGEVISQVSFKPTASPFKMGVSGSSAALVAGEAIASVALAIYLLVVGILVFRDSFSSPRLLRIYAWIKIVLAILAGVGMTWLAYEFAVSVTSNMPTTVAATKPSLAYIAVWCSLLTILGAAFPIGLLIALRSRTAQEFFNSAASHQVGVAK